jgi:hypothetical protein
VAVSDARGEPVALAMETSVLLRAVRGCVGSQLTLAAADRFLLLRDAEKTLALFPQLESAHA